MTSDCLYQRNTYDHSYCNPRDLLYFITMEQLQLHQLLGPRAITSVKLHDLVQIS